MESLFHNNMNNWNKFTEVGPSEEMANTEVSGNLFQFGEMKEESLLNISLEEGSSLHDSSGNFAKFEISETEDSEPPRKIRKSTPKKWNYESTFDSEAEAEAFIKSEQCWSMKNMNNTLQGKVKYFRCNRVKARGVQCSAGIKLIWESRTDSAHLYRAEGHTCDSTDSKGDKELNDDMKKIIEDLYKKKIKPKAIFENLCEMHPDPPSITQLNNFLTQLRKSVNGTPAISFGDLYYWLQSNSECPEGNDEAFVLNHSTGDEDSGLFRFIISSKMLLHNVLASKGNLILHIDTTSKLMWQGFSVMLVGITDCDRKFHLLGFAICMRENSEDFEFIFSSFKSVVNNIFDIEIKPKILVADSLQSIRNGFQKVFVNCPVRVCWAHVRSCVHKSALSLSAKRNVDKILDDVDFIQASEDSDVFLKSCSLFLKKWKSEEKFIKYFREEWIELNSSWYEGYSCGTPSTNSALETSVRLIKNEYMLREKLPLEQFCSIIKEIIEAFSKKYTNGSLQFAGTVTYDIQLWNSAFRWARLNQKVQLIPTDTERVYIIPSGVKLEVDPSYTLETNVDDFDEFKKRKSSFYKVHLPLEDENWQKGHCTCPSFFRRYICIHILGIAIRFEYVKPPSEA